MKMKMFLTNLWSVMKTVLGGKFVVLSASIKKEERLKSVL